MTDEPEALAVSVTVNGSQRRVPVTSGDTLLDMLRWRLGLTGTKECCAEGECGACTVLLDGRAVNACLVLAVEVDGARIVTVEGLAEAGRRSPLQEAFLREIGRASCRERV